MKRIDRHVGSIEDMSQPFLSASHRSANGEKMLRVLKRLLAIVTLAIVLLSGIGIGIGIEVVVANESRTSSGTQTGTSESPGIGADPNESVPSSAEKGKSAASSGKDSILVDAPDDQVEHANLEGFIQKRPLEAYRIVIVDSDALRTVIREINQHPRFELQLLSPSPVILIASDAEEHSENWPSGIATWKGAVAGDDYSYATFIVLPDGSVNGEIFSRESGRIAIDPIPDTPYHIVWRLRKDFEQIID